MYPMSDEEIKKAIEKSAKESLEQERDAWKETCHQFLDGNIRLRINVKRALDGKMLL